MPDLARLLDDVYGAATVTTLAPPATEVETTPPAPIALPDPAPLPPAGPDPAELLDGFFDLGVAVEDEPAPVEDEPAPVEEAPASASYWQPGDDDILPVRGARRLGLRLRRG